MLPHFLTFLAVLDSMNIAYLVTLNACITFLGWCYKYYCFVLCFQRPSIQRSSVRSLLYTQLHILQQLQSRHTVSASGNFFYNESLLSAFGA